MLAQSISRATLSGERRGEGGKRCRESSAVNNTVKRNWPMPVVHE